MSLLDRVIESRAIKVEDWMWDAFGIEKTDAGIKVSQSSALKYTALYACVRVIAETLASVPLKVYQRGSGDSRSAARDHQLYQILHSRPNDYMSSFQLVETLQAHVLTWGNAYAELQKDGGGRVRQIWPLRPDRSEIVLVGRSNRKVLKYRMQDGTERLFEPGQYLHICGLGYDGYQGYSVVSYHKQAIAHGLAGEKYGAKFFGSGGKPPLILKTPTHLSDEAAKRMRAKFERIHGSIDQSHRSMVLDEGLEVQEIGMSNEDAQFLETRKFQVEEIARIFRVPLHKIQSLDKATFSNIEHQSIEFAQDTIRPWAVRWEQAMNWELFAPVEREVFYTEFDLDGLLRGDAKSRAEALAIQRQWGIINADEWRALENMNSIPGGSGEIYLVPMNMIPLDQAEEEEEEEPPEEPDEGEEEEEEDEDQEEEEEPEDEEEEDERGWRSERRAFRSAALRQRQAQAYIRVFQRAADHFVNRETRFALRALKRAFDQGKPITEFLDELRRFYESFPDAIRRELLPVVLAFARLMADAVSEEVGDFTDQDLAVEKMARDYVEVYIKRHIGSSQYQIERIIEDIGTEDLQAALQQRFEEWEATRAAKIAQNETVRAAGALSKAAYVAAGISFLVWATIGESCPLCWEMDGRRVGVDQNFLGPGDSVDPKVEGTAPLQVKGPVSHPPLHRGCDCMIIAGL